jgi:hypothetical protein
MGKGYMPLFFDTLEETEDLTDEEFGRLIRAAGSYAMGTDAWEEIITGNERYAFRFLRGQIDRNIEISKARAKAGSTRREQTETKANKTQQTETKQKKETRFVPPTIDDVRAYCRERGNKVNAERFVDFYASKGWKVGNQPMKDWKACVRTWEKGENQKVVSAQTYTQRDYTGEDEEAMRRMLGGA